MRQSQTTIKVPTTGQGCFEVTHHVEAFVAESGIGAGLLTLFIQHTSASLTIQENADPDVQLDLTDSLHRLAPENPRLYRHTCEGPDDMPAHVKAALTDVSLSIPVKGGQLALGTWQGVYVLEHRQMPHTRRIVCHLIGE